MKKLPQEIRKKIEHGDRKKIAMFSGITDETIGNCIAAGEGTRKTVEAIEDYYIHIENVRNEQLQKKGAKR